ncbi:MAG: acyl-CoA desaturase [Gemmataceae bacterium]|nr:acyl-CoA desaturase [Gemmataceae bacterium]
MEVTPGRYDDDPDPLPVTARLATLAAVVIPFLGLIAALVLLWGWGFGWVEFGLLAGMYVLTALGITVGFHRLFTHRSFETNPVVRFVLAVLGSMAVQGSVLKWVALHRRHHQHSDTPADPHSPHHQGRGVLGLIRGFWHAHIGWAFRSDPSDLSRYVTDLRKFASVRVASALFPLWIVLGLVIPTVLGGLLTGTWAGALLGLVWGGLARVCLVHHVTWSVNSVCHLWGRRPYPEGDHSRNNFVFGVLALGEGWHNNHHAFPTSARHGLRWWQIDVSYYVIRLLALVGLAWRIRLPANRPASAPRHQDLPEPAGSPRG